MPEIDWYARTLTFTPELESYIRRETAAGWFVTSRETQAVLGELDRLREEVARLRALTAGAAPSSAPAPSDGS